MSHPPQYLADSSPPKFINTPALRFLHTFLRQMLRITTTDGRVFIGLFAGTDQPLNVLLVNAEEYRVWFPPEGAGTDAPRSKNGWDGTGRLVGQVMIPWRLVVRVEAFMPNKGKGVGGGTARDGGEGMYM